MKKTTVLIGMQRGQSKFLFSYDSGGNVASVNYNGTEYYYLRDAQGNIVKIVDSSGASKVEYTYDTWGKKVTTTGALSGTLGLFQPFRYRGYVYDWELGFYYLQSRYYDPAVGRFISADILLSTGQGVLGHNTFAYCLGNPVMMSDASGCSGNLYRTWTETYTGRDEPIRGFERKPDRYYLQDQLKPWAHDTVYYNYGEEDFAIESFLAGDTVYYRGILIEESFTDSSFSILGTIFLNRKYAEDKKYRNWMCMTLKHEYGHTVQEKKIGLGQYIIHVAAPSVLTYWASKLIPFINDYYFNFTQERGADYYGGVTEDERSHSWLSNIDWWLQKKLLYGD